MNTQLQQTLASWRKVSMLIILMVIGATVSAQWTYQSSYSSGAGNPGGVNSESDAPGQGTWTTVQTGVQASNIWSSAITLPFTFDFYGQAQTTCYASQNGVVTFSTSAATGTPPGANLNLPTASLPDSSIGYWDEFTASAPTGSGDDIRTNTFGTAPNRQFWIKWYSFEMGNPTASFNYFAIVLEESTNNIYVVDQYSTTTTALSLTVGVQLNSSLATQFGTNTLANEANGSANTDNDYWSFIPELVVNDNAGISALANPTSPLSVGIQNVDVVLENYGANALTSVNVAWEINGVAQTPPTFTGPLAIQSNDPAFNLGSHNFTPGFTTIKAWTSMPNGVMDANFADDTLEVSLCTALNGIYTVGGATPDFATIQEAIDALNNCGVSGPVTINLTPGTYTGGYILEEVTGASATNTITFDGGSAAVTTLTHDATGIEAVWSFQGGDFFTLKNMTLQNTGTADAWGVHLKDESDYNTVDSCIMDMYYSSGLFDVAGVCASADLTNDGSEGNNANHCTFSNNIITGGDRGMTFDGVSTIGSWNRGISLINNTISNADDYGIYFDDMDSLTVVGNIINNLQNVGAEGMYFSDIANFNISANQVTAPDWAFYIADGNFDFAATGTSLVSNNMIISETDYAIYFDDVEDVNIYHNSLVGLPAFRMNDNQNFDIRNNVFYSEGDFAFESDDAFTTTTADYNMYWTPASNANFVKEGGSTYADLSLWQGANATNNVNSLELEPNFVSPTDLHMVLGNGFDAGDNSTTTLVPFDIDGDARPLAPNPNVDMGADEWAVTINDIGVSAVDAPLSPVLIGIQNVDVSIQNFGANTVNSAVVDWEAQGIAQPSFNWPGSVAAFSEVNDITLGTYNFTSGFTTLKFWTSLPNAFPDQNFTNDTLEVTLCTGLTGVYTVGGATPDFVDVNEAITALLNCGVSGPTTINITPGTYTGGYILTPIQGASATNTITFNGLDVATTILTHDASTIEAVWSFQGVNYVTLKNMTIQNTGTVDAWGVHLKDASDYNTVDSCIFDMHWAANVSDVAAICASNDLINDASEGNNASHCTFSNNTITGGERGLTFDGTFTVGSWNSDINILNNTISNVDDYGIYFDDMDSLQIIGNSITDVQNANGDGIYLFDVANFNVSSNNISVTDWGIYIADANFEFPATGASLVSNNMVLSSSDYAMYWDDVEDVNVFHNSLVGNPAFRMNDNLNIDIRNNIFSSESDYAFEADDAFNTVTADYNLYWTPASNTSFVKEGANIHADLTAWTAANLTNNGSSVELEPFFVSASDLHMLGANGNDVGDNTVGILTDIDGDTRPQSPSTTVDMGADEFTPNPFDAAFIAVYEPTSGVCGDAATTVSIIVQNLGIVPITSLPISVDITGAVTQTVNFTYSGNIAFGELDTVLVSVINTYDGGTVNIGGFVTLPNDADASNDTLSPQSFDFIPVEPIAINAVACGIDSALLAVDSTFTTSFEWYDAATAGNLVAEGASYMVPSIAAQSTYYAQYKASSPDDLTTLFAGGNGCTNGNMFDLESTSATTMTEICVNANVTAGNNTTIDVYYIIGSSYTTGNNNAGAWTLEGTYNVVSAGSGNPTCFTLNNGIDLPAGTVVGMYIDHNASYTNYTGTPPTYTSSSGNITLTQGIGLCTAFSGTLTREFNGSFEFGSVSCSTTRVPVTATNATPVSVDLGSDTVVCGSSLDLNTGAANASNESTWSTTDVAPGITVSTSDTYFVNVVDTTSGCSDSDTIDVTIDNFSVSLGTDLIFCDGDSVSLTAGAASAYAWSTGDTTASINVDTAGTFIVEATNANGCTDTDTLDTSVDPLVDGDFTVTSDSTSLTWSFSDLSVAADSVYFDFGDGSGSSTLTASNVYGATGNYTVCHYAFNNCNTDTTCINITAVNVGIRDAAENISISLYPNPTNGEIALSLGLENEESIDVQIFSVIGNELFSETIKVNNMSTYTKVLNVENFANGTYLVKVTGTQGSIVKTFVKK